VPTGPYRPVEMTMATERLPMRTIREILRLKWLLHRSHRETARSLGISAGAVASVVTRAAVRANIAKTLGILRVSFESRPQGVEDRLRRPHRRAAQAIPRHSNRRRQAHVLAASMGTALSPADFSRPASTCARPPWASLASTGRSGASGVLHFSTRKRLLYLSVNGTERSRSGLPPASAIAGCWRTR